MALYGEKPRKILKNRQISHSSLRRAAAAEFQCLNSHYGAYLNYDALEKTYWEAQKQRIENLRQKISGRPSIGDGRVVPADEDLSIGDGRRLKMAVMFIDICGFSSRPMGTSEEQDLMLRILNLYFTEMIKIAEEYGGNVEKNTGDGLLIYFNDNEGNPPENGPKRAVACALTMFAATNYLINPIIKLSNAKPIDFRVSIDYGRVTVARIGAPRRFNANVAIGTTANIASKVMRFAQAGEIVIGESAKNLLPVGWANSWAELMPEPSGWTYTATGAPYMLYKYIGRWKNFL